MEPSRAEGPTTAGLARAPRRTTVVLRGTATALLAAFVLLAAAGLFGERTSVARAVDSAGRTLEVTYAPISRGGLDTPWRVEVTDPAGLPAKLDLAVDPHYFTMFETQRFFPEPESEQRDAERWLMTFATGGATSFVVEYDAYIQPRFDGGRAGSVEVVDPGREPLVVHFRTALMP